MQPLNSVILKATSAFFESDASLIVSPDLALYVKQQLQSFCRNARLCLSK